MSDMFSALIDEVYDLHMRWQRAVRAGSTDEAESLSAEHKTKRRKLNALERKSMLVAGRQSFREFQMQLRDDVAAERLRAFRESPPPAGTPEWFAVREAIKCDQKRAESRRYRERQKALWFAHVNSMAVTTCPRMKPKSPLATPHPPCVREVPATGGSRRDWAAD